MGSNKGSLQYLELQGVTQDKTTRIYFPPSMMGMLFPLEMLKLRNLRMVWVRKNLKNHLVPPPATGRDPFPSAQGTGRRQNSLLEEDPAVQITREKNTRQTWLSSRCPSPGTASLKLKIFLPPRASGLGSGSCFPGTSRHVSRPQTRGGT